MKRAYLLVIFVIPLLAIKCAQDSVKIEIVNNTNNDIVFGVEKHSLKLAKLLSILEIGYMSNDTNYLNLKRNEKMNLKKIIKDSIDYSGLLDVIKSKKISKFNFPSETYLSTFSSKNEEQLVFYFYRIKNEQIVQNVYDSIIINKEKIKIGEKRKNIFIYDNKKILFKSE